MSNNRRLPTGTPVVSKEEIKPATDGPIETQAGESTDLINVSDDDTEYYATLASRANISLSQLMNEHITPYEKAQSEVQWYRGLKTHYSNYKKMSQQEEQKYYAKIEAEIEKKKMSEKKSKEQKENELKLQMFVKALTKKKIIPEMDSFAETNGSVKDHEEQEEQQIYDDIEFEKEPEEDYEVENKEPSVEIIDLDSESENDIQEEDQHLYNNINDSYEEEEVEDDEAEIPDLFVQDTDGLSDERLENNLQSELFEEDIEEVISDEDSQGELFEDEAEEVISDNDDEAPPSSDEVEDEDPYAERGPSMADFLSKYHQSNDRNNNKDDELQDIKDGDEDNIEIEEESEEIEESEQDKDSDLEIVDLPSEEHNTVSETNEEMEINQYSDDIDNEATFTNDYQENMEDIGLLERLAQIAGDLVEMEQELVEDIVTSRQDSIAPIQLSSEEERTESLEQTMLITVKDPEQVDDQEVEIMDVEDVLNEISTIDKQDDIISESIDPILEQEDIEMVDAFNPVDEPIDSIRPNSALREITQSRTPIVFKQSTPPHPVTPESAVINIKLLDALGSALKIHDLHSKGIEGESDEERNIVQEVASQVEELTSQSNGNGVERVGSEPLSESSVIGNNDKLEINEEEYINSLNETGINPEGEDKEEQSVADQSFYIESTDESKSPIPPQNVQNEEETDATQVIVVRDDSIDGISANELRNILEIENIDHILQNQIGEAEIIDIAPNTSHGPPTPPLDCIEDIIVEDETGNLEMEQDSIIEAGNVEDMAAEIVEIENNEFPCTSISYDEETDKAVKSDVQPEQGYGLFKTVRHMLGSWFSSDRLEEVCQDDPSLEANLIEIDVEQEGELEGDESILEGESDEENVPEDIAEMIFETGGVDDDVDQVDIELDDHVSDILLEGEINENDEEDDEEVPADVAEMIFKSGGVDDDAEAIEINILDDKEDMMNIEDGEEEENIPEDIKEMIIQAGGVDDDVEMIEANIDDIQEEDETSAIEEEDVPEDVVQEIIKTGGVDNDVEDVEIEMYESSDEIEYAKGEDVDLLVPDDVVEELTNDGGVDDDVDIVQVSVEDDIEIEEELSEEDVPEDIKEQIIEFGGVDDDIDVIEAHVEDEDDIEADEKLSDDDIPEDIQEQIAQTGGLDDDVAVINVKIDDEIVSTDDEQLTDDDVPTDVRDFIISAGGLDDDVQEINIEIQDNVDYEDNEEYDSEFNEEEIPIEIMEEYGDLLKPAKPDKWITKVVDPILQFTSGVLFDVTENNSETEEIPVNITDINGNTEDLEKSEYNSDTVAIPLEIPFSSSANTGDIEALSNENNFIDTDDLLDEIPVNTVSDAIPENNDSEEVPLLEEDIIPFDSIPIEQTIEKPQPHEARGSKRTSNGSIISRLVSFFSSDEVASISETEVQDVQDVQDVQNQVTEIKDEAKIVEAGETPIEENNEESVEEVAEEVITEAAGGAVTEKQENFNAETSEIILEGPSIVDMFEVNGDLAEPPRKKRKGIMSTIGQLFTKKPAHEKGHIKVEILENDSNSEELEEDDTIHIKVHGRSIPRVAVDLLETNDGNEADEEVITMMDVPSLRKNSRSRSRSREDDIDNGDHMALPVAVRTRSRSPSREERVRRTSFTEPEKLVNITNRVLSYGSGDDLLADDLQSSELPRVYSSLVHEADQFIGQARYDGEITVKDAEENATTDKEENVTTDGESPTPVLVVKKRRRPKKADDTIPSSPPKRGGRVKKQQSAPLPAPSIDNSTLSSPVKNTRAKHRLSMQKIEDVPFEDRMKKIKPKKKAKKSKATDTEGVKKSKRKKRGKRS